MANIMMEEILQSWSCLLPDMANSSDKYFQFVKEEVAKRKTGFDVGKETIGGLFGRKQEYFTISMGRYTAYIGAEPMGTDLTVSWDLHDAKATKARILPTANPGAPAARLFSTAFNETALLRAFASVTHDCALVAAEKMADGTNFDKSKMQRKSSGALGPI